MIIPAFNRAVVVSEAVESALAQKVDVEVIVVDDGSTDDTVAVLSARFGSDPRVRVRSQSNAGASAARNTGLDLATGDYIAFLDSDDAWRPWHLRLMLAALDRLPEAGLVWTETDFVDADGKTVARSALAELLSAWREFSKDELFQSSSPLSELGVDLPPEFAGGSLYVGDIYSAMLMGNLVLNSSVVMRLERLQQVGRFDEDFAVGEDYEFYLRVSRDGPVAFADVPDLRYRIGTSDKLGGPRTALAMALGYLGVLDATLGRDAARITLPPRMIARARVHAHRWVGELLLLEGSQRAARAHLAQALRIRLREPWTIVLLVLTFLPPPVIQAVVESRRRLRAWLKGRGSAEGRP